MDSSCVGPFLIIVAAVIIFLVIWAIKDRNKIEDLSRFNSPPEHNQPSAPVENRIPPSPTIDTKYYQPSPISQSRPKIAFRELSTSARDFVCQTIDESAIEDLHDALTGAPLDINRGLYQCSKCKVFYHTDSYRVLTEINQSACVSCKSLDINVVTQVSKAKFGYEYQPSVITLGNYREYIGQVVTFEGYVYTVKESQRGNDFAAMYEDKSWVAGFKLVFFRGSNARIGGRRFIMGLAEKTVKVRGLIVKNDKYGYEIVVSEPGMILSVK